MAKARPWRVPISGQSIGVQMHSRPTHHSNLMFDAVQVCPLDRRMKNSPVKNSASTERLLGISSRASTRLRARVEG
ncbi:hypothetical protein D3C80_1450030 [compost metagenome]